MAGIAALTSIFIALVAAPLILGTGIVLQRTGTGWRALWLGLLTLLLLASFGAGALALVLLLADGSPFIPRLQ
jgi:hypothetical protein